MYVSVYEMIYFSYYLSYCFLDDEKILNRKSFGEGINDIMVKLVGIVSRVRKFKLNIRGLGKKSCFSNLNNGNKLETYFCNFNFIKIKLKSGKTSLKFGL